MATDDTTTEAQDDILAEYLARGWTQKAAGEVAGVSDRTVSRRMADPSFRSEVNRRSDVIVDGATRLLGDVTRKAIERLSALTDSSDENVALRASRALASLLLPLEANVRLKRRMEAVEQQLGIPR